MAKPPKLFLITCLAANFLSSCSSSDTRSIAITHVTVIDPAKESVRPDSTVILYKSQIAAVGPFSGSQIPANAKIIDATGKYMIPGLVDMHLHLTGAGEPTGSRELILPLLVANGVTTVRDMGGEVALLKQLQKEINSEKQLGPQVFFTGPYLDGDPPAFQPSIVIRTVSEAAVAVKKLKSEGVDFLKVQSRLQPEAYFSIARDARESGIRYVGHVPDSVSAGAASDAGQASIEHLTGILIACSIREDELRERQLAPSPVNGTLGQSQSRMRHWLVDLFDSYSAQKAANLFRKFSENHTVQVPTLPLLIHLAFLTPQTDRVNDPRMKYIPGNLRIIWEQGREKSLAGQSAEDFALRRQLAEWALSVVKEMHRAGVSIMAGTDTTAPNVFPGFSLHEDLSYLVQSGLTTMEALQAATFVPAQFLGVAAKQGAIAPGQRADLLLLDANPLDDIAGTQKIRAVILNGKLLDRNQLDELLKTAERFASAH